MTEQRYEINAAAIATPDEIADAEANVAEAMATRDSIMSQLDDEIANPHRGSDWLLRARVAFAHAKKDLTIARADLKALKSDKRLKYADLNLRNQKEKHKLKIARVQAAVVRQQAGLKGVIQWVFTNYPDRMKEVYAAKDAAQADCKAKQEVGQ